MENARYYKRAHPILLSSKIKESIIGSTCVLDGEENN
jgi:hypothetical protein